VSAGSHDDSSDNEDALPPSKSARKRAAHAAQDLGETLLQLKDAELEALALPERLLDALREARRITSRAGLARQRQFIGKLMRSLDTEPIRAALEARHEQAARETERFKRVENWRARLLAEGEEALAELVRWHPDIPLREWQQRVSAARSEQARLGGGGPASRELFRALRTLFATMS
jgi:ribosome-associated protein